MKLATKLSLIFGILLIIGSFIVFILYTSGEPNSKLEKELEIPQFHYFTVGGERADRVIAEYSATESINVYLTTNKSVKHEHLSSIESLDNYVTLDEGNTSGHIEYNTPDSDKEYYIIFNNPNNSTVNLDVNVEFEYTARTSNCLLSGIILLVSGAVLLAYGLLDRKRQMVVFIETVDD
jgi:hypothetical protein